jgi:hypothetical protein
MSNPFCLEDLSATYGELLGKDHRERLVKRIERFRRSAVFWSDSLTQAVGNPILRS